VAITIMILGVYRLFLAMFKPDSNETKYAIHRIKQLGKTVSKVTIWQHLKTSLFFFLIVILFYVSGYKELDDVCYSVPQLMLLLFWDFFVIFVVQFLYDYILNDGQRFYWYNMVELAEHQNKYLKYFENKRFIEEFNNDSEGKHIEEFSQNVGLLY